MDLLRTIADLSRSSAYPHPASAVEIRQTHISLVFLAGDFVYKLKKPVDLGFLDFTTLAKRKHFCEEETRLNRRLAPGVYLGIVAVTEDTDGLRIEGSGPIVDWAVKMVRLPDAATLRQHLRDGNLTPTRLAALAGRIARFHRLAEANACTAEFGRFPVVAQNARENFEQSQKHVGITIHETVWTRLQEVTDSVLTALKPIIESRAARGVPRDTHGDLRLDHVYHFPERSPPDNWVVIDCIEFAERFRFADPVADTAFLIMDLRFAGRRDLASAFTDAYFLAANDAEGRILLPFYVAYRAMVRAKVEGLTAAEPEVPAEEREAVRQRGRAYWLLALGQLEEPARRPALVVIGGLPGTGKTTLTRGLAVTAGFEIIRTDVVRKELAGIHETAPAGAAAYSEAEIDRIYRECLRRAELRLIEGKRVAVEATFAAERHRDAYRRIATALGVPSVFLVCELPAVVVRARLAARVGDASDADWTVYEKVAQRWEPPRHANHVINTRESHAAIAAAHAMLREAELL